MGRETKKSPDCQDEGRNILLNAVCNTKTTGAKYGLRFLTKLTLMKKMTLLALFLAIFFQSLAPVNPDGVETVVRGVQKQHQENYIAGILMEVEQYLPENFNTSHVVYIHEVARELRLPIDLVFRLVKQESGFNQYALSHKGAYGYMQLMPRTYLYYYDKMDLCTEFIDIDNPYVNILIGLTMLRELYDIWGRWDLALASYNAGLGNVRRFNGVPPFRETEDYIKIILS